MKMTPKKGEGGAVTRRGLFGLTASMGSAALLPACALPEPGAAGQAMQPDAGSVAVHLRINGQAHALEIAPMVTLADALRERLGLTGTKIGCNHGQCGACTVHVDGRRVLACLTLAAVCEGKAITTIEGVASADGSLHPMQQAFIDHDAFQCGYCTPGQIMSAIALVKEGRLGSDDEVKEYMSGNLCRCAAYPKIVAAVTDGARLMRP
ncbi:(2Fe-2S)-binding protein [Variovorax boronicumulans]|uniref:(2Fe-2S)-binding protein n=1 Tax=Variovorax boronicumulans TaxID=436515 RepID=UPI001C56865F